jgi:hypothetical protein
MIDRKWLQACDLMGREVTAQIESVSPGEVKGVNGTETKKPVIRFRGQPKPYAAGATVCKTIAKMYGSNDTSDWVGKWVTLYPSTTPLGGEIVECIRVRPRVPEIKPKRDQDGAQPAAGGDAP